MREIKQKIEKIYQNKYRKSEYYFGIQIKTLQVLYKNLLDENLNLQKAYKEIVSVLNHDEIDLNIKVNYFNLSKKILEKKKNNPSLDPFLLLCSSKAYEKTKKIMNATIKREQGREIKEEIANFVKENRKSRHIFYLVSYHSDCATDHIPYQGKMYVDRTGLTQDEKIEADKHGVIASFQEIIGAPVWLITRPNCRHYFVVLTLDEIKGKTNSELLRKYDMIHKIGPRNKKTINHAINKGRYSETNVKSIIRQYERREFFHKALRKINHKDTELNKMLLKDKLLVEKWNDFYKNNY